MELLNYLYSRFLTEEQVLAAAGVARERLAFWQQRGMPQPSYRLRLDLACHSFFGQHEERADLCWYPPAYAAWLAQLEAGMDGQAEFRRRYRARLAQLASGSSISDAELDEEWQHFLAGTYGLCSRSGLPEDIAAKEWATRHIRQLSEQEQALTVEETQTLRGLVKLLDQTSASFAPHERPRSSRARWIDGLHLRFGWSSNGA